MSLGPVMVDLRGTRMDAGERELLAHPAVGGVILFSRNFENTAQLRALCKEVHALRSPHLLVAVDHEGGRVQRFREGFTRLPAMARLGELHQRDPQEALALAHDGGWLMASELLAHGVDLSFAPVLDVDRRRSKVIGDRAFADDPDVVSGLGRAWIHGMREAGMASVGKHFPGHGGVAEDSHDSLPRDDRDLAAFRLRDMQPFERLMGQDPERAALAGIMTAHLQVPHVDELPVTFSRTWLIGILREQLGFTGTIFSDDLSMHATLGLGGAGDRALAAMEAGCDMVLVCNDRQAAEEAVDACPVPRDAVRASRVARLHGRAGCDWRTLVGDPRHARVGVALESLDAAPELDLHDDNQI